MELTGRLLILAVLLYFVSAAEAAAKIKMMAILRFKEFKDCDLPGTPNRVANAKVSLTSRGVNLINMDFVVKKPINRGKLRLVISKCAADCEDFLKFNVDFCNVLGEKGMPWSSFLNTVNPRIKCPVKKGTYRVENGTVDITDILKLGSARLPQWMEQFNWMVEFWILGGNEEPSACGRCVWVFSWMKVPNKNKGNRS